MGETLQEFWMTSYFKLENDGKRFLVVFSSTIYCVYLKNKMMTRRTGTNIMLHRILIAIFFVTPDFAEYY